MEVLGEDRFVVVVGAGHRFANRKKISLQELIEERWILYPSDNVIGSFISAAFRQDGQAAPRHAVTTFSLHIRMHLLATGRFVTIMQRSVLRYNAKRWALKALPIELAVPAVPLASFTLSNRTLSPAVERFLEHARELLKSRQNPLKQTASLIR
jgi:DNA-binding transcriptional LysR family regulator